MSEPQQPTQDQIVQSSKVSAYLEGVETLGDQMEPSSLTGMYKLAEILSRAKLIPAHFQGDAASTMLVMMQAKQIGVPIVTATQTCYVVSGKVGWSSVVLQSLAKRSPRCKKFYLKHVDSKSATMVVQTSDMDEPVEVTYTIEMAQRAGLITRNKGTWEGSTEDMLVARVGSKAARRYFPEELAGIYSVEELREIPADPEIPRSKPTGPRNQVLLDRLAGGEFDTPVVPSTPVAPEPEDPEPAQGEILDEPPVERIGPEIAKMIREVAKKTLGKFGERMLEAEIKRRWAITVEELTPEQSDAIDEWIAETKKNAGA